MNNKTEYIEQPVETSVEDDARPVNHLSVHLGEHWGIVSSTGGGKTVFATRGLLEYLRKQYPEVPRYILDSTGDPDMINLVHNPRQVTGNIAPDLLRDPSKTLVWTPDNGKLPQEYYRWFERLNDSRKPAIIILDEIASITGNALDGLETLFKQMRKHNGTVIALTQQISKVDTTIFTQLTHFVQMHLNPHAYDLAVARQYLNMSKDEQRQPLHPYGLFYRRTRGQTKYEEFRDYQHFFKE